MKKSEKSEPMTYQYHDESIVKNLDEHTVFVFGSNMAGQHADGAARTALEHFGAIKDVGRGWSGQSYAIPTMNEHLQQMPLSQIQHYIDDFKIYTKNHPKMTYFLTSIGCGIAGYKVEEIAPMFKGISHNVIFPASFRPFVERTLPRLNKKFLHTIFNDAVIFSTQNDDMLIQHLALTDNEKSLPKLFSTHACIQLTVMVAIVCLKLKIFYMRCRGKYLILRPTLRGACFLVVPF